MSVISERSEKIESSPDTAHGNGANPHRSSRDAIRPSHGASLSFTAYKGAVQSLLHDKGWSARGVFRAFIAFRVHDAYVQGESAEAFACRIDRDAPLGMAV